MEDHTALVLFWSHGGGGGGGVGLGLRLLARLGPEAPGSGAGQYRLLSLNELLLGKVEQVLFQGMVPEYSAVGRLSVLALFSRFFSPQLRKDGFLVTLRPLPFFSSWSYAKQIME